MLGSNFNFEDVFFRDLTVCVLDTLEGQVKWVNRFSSGDVQVNVPFYYSLTGDERFLLDSFQDDIVSENRFIELNTDIIPRGHLTMTGFNIKSDEFANPNVWLRMVVENESEIRKILSRVRAIPITVNYDLNILLETEIDTFKCSQAIMDTLWIYKFMYFEHNFMNIDAMILMPDTNQVEMSREKNLTSDNKIQIKVSFEVSTYYPAFRRDRIAAPGYNKTDGTGMTDLNGYTINSTNSDFYSGDVINGTASVNNTGGGGGGGSHIPSPNPLGPDRFGGWPKSYPQPLIIDDESKLGTYSVEFGTGSNKTTKVFQANGYGKPTSWTDGSQVNPFGTSLGANSVNNGSVSTDPDYYLIAPKRTRWFNNILKAREKSTSPINNPNNNKPPGSQYSNSNPPTDPNN